MSHKVKPIIDQWYSHKDKGQRFYVVAFEETNALVEIQHFDGDLEEIELKEWYQWNIEQCEEPENWSGATDIGNPDDYGTEITDTVAADWNEPLRQFPYKPR